MKWYWWAALALTISSGVVWKMTRGLRNNNPGNLRPGGGDWLGLVGYDPAAGGPDSYLVFDTVDHGLRAMAITLANYQRHHGINTVNGIIARYAPAADGNPEAAYAGFVAGRLGIAPDQQFDVIGRLPDLMAAMISFEQGFNPYSREHIANVVAASV